MGAWNLTAGLLLLMVFLKTQASEAVHKGNTSHGLQRKVFLDFRQNGPELTKENIQVMEDFMNCAEKWFASVGDSCGDRDGDDPMNGCTFYNLLVFYKGDDPGTEFKEIIQRSGSCRPGLACSDSKCECFPRFEDDTFCDDQKFQKQDLMTNCNRQSKALLSAYRREIVRIIQSSGSDPGQNIPCTYLMAVILFVLAVR